MGTVYLASRADDAFQKLVAVKVLRRGMGSEAIIRRFRHERQILAGLNHPNIAGLFDGGTTPEGLPYFAMEYVEGRSTATNPGDVELSVALALALNGRGDAFAAFARRGVPGGRRSDDLAAAVRDYTEGVALLEKLQGDGAIAGSDLDTLNVAKAELAKLSTESGALHGSH
jgi:hypothetical protein